jgi:hypothetical protein
VGLHLDLSRSVIDRLGCVVAKDVQFFAIDMIKDASEEIADAMVLEIR